MELHVVTICLLLGLSAGVSLADHTSDRLARVESLLTDVLERNGELERQNDAVKLANKLLEQRVARLEEKKTLKEDGIKEVVGLAEEDHGDDDSRDVEQLEKSKHAKRFVSDFQGSSVAFTAIVSPPQLSNLGSGQAVIYDTTVTNVGGAYHNKTGIFTAPATGVYVFNFAVMMDPGFSEYIELVKNGDHVLWNYGHAPGASHLISASRTVTMELQAGDLVWIRTRNSSVHGNGILHGYGFTTFSGWLIALYDI